MLTTRNTMTTTSAEGNPKVFPPDTPSQTTMTTASTEGKPKLFYADTPYNRLRYDVLHRRYKARSMMKHAVKIFNPVSTDPMSSEVLDRLEEVFGLGDVKWTPDPDRELILLEVYDTLLERSMRRYGYNICWYGCGSIGIRPFKGTEKEKKPLPTWLDELGAFVVDNETRSFRRESFLTNQKIGAGTALENGTLGPIMTSSPSVPELASSVYVALTAGHVIPDGFDDIDLAIPGEEGRIVKLKVSKTSRRLQERRIYGDPSRPGTDDVGFLVLSPEDLDIAEHQYHNINVHYFSFRALGKSAMLQPLIQPRVRSIRKALRRSSILVFKRGAGTDLTMGHFSKLQREPPEGWYSDSELSDLDSSFIEFIKERNLNTRNGETQSGLNPVFSDLSETSSVSSSDTDDDASVDWFGEVTWSDVGFAGPGDSGSLVFAIESGVFVPLGIHLGSLGSGQGPSYFLCLETFCEQARIEG
ncbi:uncharacterized protein BJX67DRAFT_345046 [Aspergillus lucknowensis]|uniref:Uncharacterized protein n=1 Tax=Aspergillus lucknowensis TaxID=176173 RepID=A0ABR4M0C7_9EURO